MHTGTMAAFLFYVTVGRRLKNAVVPFFYFAGWKIMMIKNQRFVVIVKEAQIFSVTEIHAKLERPLEALRRLQQGESLPDTFKEVALDDIQQAMYLLEGTREFVDGRKDD
jgi:hypothetical protein